MLSEDDPLAGLVRMRPEPHQGSSLVSRLSWQAGVGARQLACGRNGDLRRMGDTESPTLHRAALPRAGERPPVIPAGNMSQAAG
jgi:hypothetical protein